MERRRLLSVLYVDVDATGGGSGADWTNAYTDPQSALSAAGSGDEIWVAEGTYKPHSTDRAVSFELKNGVDLYGGFAGTESTLSQRDWTTNMTVFSGDIGAVGDASDNSYHVVCADAVTNCVLDGFTITGGNADGSEGWQDVGGGMFNDNSSPTLVNLIFSDNYTGVSGRGGGMYNKTSSPTLTTVVFSGNGAIDGGGMLNYESSPTLTNVTFSNNVAHNAGGGMRNIDGVPTLTQVIFTGNNARSGGGISNDDSSPTLANVTFSDNVAYSGGGMHNGGGSPKLADITFNGNWAVMGGGMLNYESSPTLDNVIFSGNGAGKEGGGGMYNVTSAPTLTNITFTDNRADEYGGGMYNYNASSPTLTNVTFSVNHASDYGGGMYNETSSPALTNVIFSGNWANVDGGGMYNLESSPTLTNTAFVGNRADYGGGVYSKYQSSPMLINVTFSSNSAHDGRSLYNEGNCAPTVTNSILWGDKQIYDDATSVSTVTHSIVEGSWTSTGNLDVDPLFLRTPDAGADGTWGTVDDDYGDLRLQLTSPAIDAGDNSAVNTSHDLDLMPRRFDVASVVDTGLGTAPLVDRGAYEVRFGMGLDDRTLSVYGTTAADRVTLRMTGRGLSVRTNFAGKETYDPTLLDRAVIYLAEGNDRLNGGNSPIPIVGYGGGGRDRIAGGNADDILLGEAGDDVLSGRNGNDVLLGGTGSDRLVGAGDRDLLIGGIGADRLSGGGGDDVLLAGRTSYDSDLEAQEMLVTEWGSGRTFAERIENLDGTGAAPPNDPYYLIAVGMDQTCFGDPDIDVLVGGRDNDWLIGDAFDTLRSGEELSWM